MGEEITSVLGMFSQAPAVAAVIVVVVLFLRHISKGDELNRETNRELAAALRELTSKLRNGEGK